MSKNLDETVHLESEKKKSGFERLEESDYKGTSSIPVWPAHHPRSSTGEKSVRGLIVA